MTLKFEKGADLATTPLLYALARGDLIPKAVLTLFHRAKNAPVTLAITMGDVRITNYDRHLRPGRQMSDVKEKWEATYQTVDWMYQNRPAASGPNFLTQGTVRVFAMEVRNFRSEPSDPQRLHTMALTNYRDISPPLGDVGAGFQFEFFCESCGDTWKTPFKPYRAGQANGVFRRFGYLFNEFAKISVISETIYRLGRAGGTSIEATGSKAKATALEEALALGAQRYEKCSNCRTMVCANCYDEATQRCIKCDRAQGVGSQSGTSASASSTVCPNCQTPSQGGRFCHECGFDMASTHKSCPSCSATMPRQARFCTDCGHGF